MAKIRSIHPEACESADLERLSDGAERTYWRLLTHTDDEGRGKDDPRLLAAKLYPLAEDKDAAVIKGHMGELADAGLIVLYENDGKPYYQVPTWAKYQKPKYRSASKIPSPEDPSSTPRDPIDPRSTPDLPQDILTESGGTGEEGQQSVEPGPDLPPIAPRSGSDLPHGEVLEREREKRGEPPGGAADAPTAHEVDQLLASNAVPVKALGGWTYSRTLGEWAEVHGMPCPETATTRGSKAEWLLRVLGKHLPAGGEPERKRARGRAREVIADYLVDVTGEPMPDDGWGLLGRHIADAGSVETLRSIAVACESGAGLSPPHSDNPLSLFLYATKVRNGGQK